MQLPIPLPKLPDVQQKFYFPLLQKQPLGSVVQYSRSENLKKQQQIAKKQGKILKKIPVNELLVRLHRYFP